MKRHLFSILGILTTVLGIATTAQADLSITKSNFPINQTRSTISPTQTSPDHLTMNPLELAVYQQVNLYRQSLDLPPLVIDPIVSAQAKAHSEEMARTGTFGHDGFNRRADTVAQTIAYRSAAENVATSRGYSRPDLIAIQGWIESPGHHRNMIGRYDLTGIGVATNAKGEYYFTQIFIRKL
jgi:uncharacterized protein YkwD